MQPVKVYIKLFMVSKFILCKFYCGILSRNFHLSPFRWGEVVNWQQLEEVLLCQRYCLNNL